MGQHRTHLVRWGVRVWGPTQAWQQPAPTPRPGWWVTARDAMDCTALQAPLSMIFSRQKYWSGLPCPPPGDLPNPGIKTTSLTSNLHWQAGSLPLGPPGETLKKASEAPMAKD